MTEIKHYTASDLERARIDERERIAEWLSRLDILAHGINRVDHASIVGNIIAGQHMTISLRPTESRPWIKDSLRFEVGDHERAPRCRFGTGCSMPTENKPWPAPRGGSDK